MKNTTIKTLMVLFFIGFAVSTSYAQITYVCYTVPSNRSANILIKNGNTYRVTIKSCWMSAHARMGTYLIYGLNVSDPKTNGSPAILTIAETTNIDWTFSYSLSGSYDANMKVTSNGWGDQGLMIGVEVLSCSELRKN